MNVRPSTIRYRLLAASLVLAWPLVGFAAPPMDAGSGADGPGHGCPMMMAHEHGRGEHFGHFARGGHEWGLHPRFLKGLKLTEEQQDKVFAILHGAAPALREQAKALRKAHEGLRELPTSAQYDDARAKALSDAAGKALGQLSLLRTRTEHDIYGVLTPEQRAQVTERRTKWESHHHDDAPPHS